MKSLSRRGVLKTAGAAAALPVLGRGALAAPPLKVAFVHMGEAGEYGWTYAHEQGRLAAAEKLGGRVEINVIDNVQEDPGRPLRYMERIIRRMAAEGNGLIFTTSFGHMNATVKVAGEFGNVRFEHASGYKRAPNMATYNARFYEGRAVCGLIAGHMSKSGVAGYIASFPIPEVVMGINAFTLAARSVNPDFRTKVLWLSTWDDPVKEARAAKTLIDGEGADVIAQHTSTPAALQECEQRGLMAFGQAWDMSAFAPNAHLTAIANRWDVYYTDRIEKALNGSWKSADTWWGMREGMIEMTPFNSRIPADVQAAAKEMQKSIKDGSFHPFEGPIRDREGAERLGAGGVLNDGDLRKMDWYVEGVHI